MTIPKISVPVGIVASLLVSSASVGGMYATLKSSDAASTAKLEKHETQIGALEASVMEQKAVNADTRAKLDAMHEDLQIIKQAVVKP